jgi:5-(carboxyamino)imidazole ribonucleotide synthase
VSGKFRNDLCVGVLGGGQLGRMLSAPALGFGVDLAFMDADPDAPCRSLTDRFTCGSLLDYDAVYKFGRACDLVTIEIEHVNVDALADLEKAGVLVRPAARLIALVQDKLSQKEFYQAHQIPTAEFAAVDAPGDLARYHDWFPAMLKLRRSGYDGRGVMKLNSPADAARAFDAPALIERRVDFIREIAVIVSRNPSGEIATFPAVEMEFHPEANLVEFLFSPTRLDPAEEATAQALARRVAEALELEGLLAVEMFQTADGRFLVNEIAPRPHNSGHHTIEACVTSQFEQFLRAILDLPPGDTRLIQPAVMVNLLGAEGHAGAARYVNMEKVLAWPGVHLHLYGKRLTRPFRKMGHITVTAARLDDAITLARRVRDTVRVESNNE